MTRWAPLPRHPGYEVSDEGQVRNACTRHVLATDVSDSGYLRVGIRGKHYRVHRLVLEAFVGPRSRRFEGEHHNDDRLDNRPENLRWVTRRTNEKKKRSHARVVGAAKLSRAERIAIAVAASRGRSHRSLAARFGVSRGAIYTIVRRGWAA